MWKPAALGLFLTLLLAACSPSPVCPGLTCPVAHWPLNEAPGATSVADVVPNPIFNTGTAQPGPVQSLFNLGGPWSVPGHTGGALYFPGNGASDVEVLVLGLSPCYTCSRAYPRKESQICAGLYRTGF